jgi:hypothetical protein
MERLALPHVPARPAPSARRRGAAPPRFAAPRRAASRLAAPALLLAALLALLLPAVAAPARADAPDKYAGTYRIESWRELQARRLYHFFYLAPDGHFLLGADWPGHERSQFVGTWSVEGDVLVLRGQGHVTTNEGAWDAAFERSYRIQLQGAGFVLAPEPQKNRYGLMGWPQYYRFFRRAPAPNLPEAKLPEDAQAMAAYIAAALAKQKP